MIEIILTNIPCSYMMYIFVNQSFSCHFQTDFENLIDLQISTRIQQDKKGAAESRSSKRSSTKSTPAGSPRSSPLVTKRQNKRTDEESKRSNSKHLLPPFL